MRIAILIAGSIVLFLVAAKVHGWQLRLERESLGVMQVVFGGQNPPVVEALWSAERWRFWLLAPALAAIAGIALRLAGTSRATTLVGALLWAPSVAFLVLAGASALRRADTQAPAGQAAPVLPLSEDPAPGIRSSRS